MTAGVRTLLVCGVTALTALGVAGARAWRHTSEFRLALAEIDANQVSLALKRLEALDASRPLWLVAPAGHFDYALGSTRWRADRRPDAVRALDRVPESSDRWPLAAVLRAEVLIDDGHWLPAETLLGRAAGRASGGPEAHAARKSLIRLCQMQARVAETARLLRDDWPDAPDPVRTLRDLWRAERGTPPYDTVSKALDIAEALDPNDPRVWLGRANVATQTGKLAEADAWMTRCEARRETPVLLARLAWSRAVGRRDLAAQSLRALEADALTPAARLEWRAWFARHSNDPAGERGAIAALLAIEPGNSVALNRAAELAEAAGDPKSAAAHRSAKARIDDALDRYTLAMAAPGTLGSADERVDLGRLAESAGRPDDSRAWYTLALRAAAGRVDATEALARLEARASAVASRWAAVARDPDPWAGPPVSETAAKVEAAAMPVAAPRFVDVAAVAGLTHVFRNGETKIRQMPVALGGGVGLIDIDGDDFLDVYALQGGEFPPGAGTPEHEGGDRLFRNRGNGTFEDVTARAGLGAKSSGYGHGVAVGDVNGDGRADLFVTRWRSYALYLNEGDGRFEDATARYGLGGDRDWPTSAALADLDGDGDLDLYVCHYAEWDAANPRLCRNPATNGYLSCNPKSCPARPDHLFRNDGGRFVDVSDAAGITAADSDGRGLGVVAADLDDDGKVDLFVANDKSANFLFRNLGGFKFEEIAHSVGVAGNAEGGYQAGMGVACADADGDGHPDLVVTNYYGESTSLFRNQGGGLFTDHTVPSGLGAASRLRLGFGVALADFDNDGRNDILTSNGHTDDLGDVPYRMPAQLLLGQPRGTFTDVTARAGPAFAADRLGRGLATGDLDNDGRLDALLVGHNEPLAYFHNEGPKTDHWVSFRLAGTKSNRDGVGARVSVEADGRVLTGRRIGGGSYMSANDPRLHFGLGRAGRVGRVVVRWPSGQTDEHNGLDGGRIYVLTEGEAEARAIGRHAPR